MKKLLFVICFALLFSVIYGEGLKTVIEFGGGMNLLAMGDYNKSVDDTSRSMEALGYVPDMKKITSGIGITLDYIVVFATDNGIWGVYGKSDYLIVQDPDSVIYWPDGKTKAITTDINFCADYIGLGLRRYFMKTWEVGKFNPFIGIDMGVLYSIGNKLDATGYNSSGVQVGTLAVIPTAYLFGSCAEIGTDFCFNSYFGFNFKAGYRYSKGDLTGKYIGTGIYLADHEKDMKQVVDYSGFYLNGGISISFDASKVVNNK